MILATGPTGSGKTTTLYSLLNILNTPDVNICTIEDPIEYSVHRINQTQVNPQAGLTFAKGLRSLLRHDPDVMMIGEIRDAETAEIAIHSALTGHLVLSALVLNSAARAVPLLDEDEDFILTSTLLSSWPAVTATRSRFCGKTTISVRNSTATSEVPRAGCIWRSSPIGFCRPSPTQRLVRAEIEAIRAAGADAIVYMGLGLSSKTVLSAVNGAADESWDPIRVCTSIFVGWPMEGYVGLDLASYEGWSGTDEYDEENQVFAEVTKRFAARQPDGASVVHCYTALGYDVGQTMAWGLSLAKPQDPEGLKRGLERVHRLPAAVGAPGPTSVSVHTTGAATRVVSSYYVA